MKMTFERGIEYRLACNAEAKFDNSTNAMLYRIQKVKKELAQVESRNSIIVNRVIAEENNVILVVDFISHQSLLAQSLKDIKNVFVINGKTPWPDLSSLPVEEKKIFIVVRLSFINGLFNGVMLRDLECTLIFATYTSCAGLFEHALLKYNIKKVIQIVDKCLLFKTLNSLITKLAFAHNSVEIDNSKYFELKKWCKS